MLAKTFVTRCKSLLSIKSHRDIISSAIVVILGYLIIAKGDERIITIVKSIDDYLCENSLFTCFFRQRYHHERVDYCQSLLILHSCLQFETDLIDYCRLSKLTEARLNLFNQTFIYCRTSSIYRTSSIQHLHSITMTLNHPLFVCILLLILFMIRIRT